MSAHEPSANLPGVTPALVALLVAAWPLPPDAGSDAFVQASNWPREPQWLDEWPLLSFAPPGWSVDGGVGMSIDRAWSLTRGAPSVEIAIISSAFALSDPRLARAWKLNAAEFPDAGDTNANGRLDVLDFTTVADTNGNGALDLDDVQRAWSNGLDDDGNGRIDDLCGWDFERGQPVADLDAGSFAPLLVAAPVDDGLPGIGTCPECTISPWVDGRLWRAAVASGAPIVLVDGDHPRSLEPPLLAALDGGTSWILAGSGTLATSALAVHPVVLAVRTLTSPNRASSTSELGCGGLARGNVAVSTTTCEREAAARLAGVVGLLESLHPALDAWAIRGLVSGPRLDAFDALQRASTVSPHAVPALLGTARLNAPLLVADRCALDGVPFTCDAGATMPPFEASLEAQPHLGFSRLTFERGTSRWEVSLPRPPESARGSLRGLQTFEPGSGPVRYVDPRGELTDEWLPSDDAQLPVAFGDVDGNGQSDVVWLELDTLHARAANGAPLAGFPGTLSSAPTTAPIVLEGALFTIEPNGTVRRHTAGAWAASLDAGIAGAGAAGRIDGDAFVDLAIATGTELVVLLTDDRGPTPGSWRRTFTERDVVLADVAGDRQLEVLADAVYSATGELLATLEGVRPSRWPMVVGRIDEQSPQSLVRLEVGPSGEVEVVRYDVERALRESDSLVPRVVITRLTHPPSPGGMAVADVTADRRPDLLIPTLDGLLFVVDLTGESSVDSPHSTWGTSYGAPTVGVFRNSVEYSVRTSRGDHVRFLGRGAVEDIRWDGPGHDEGNTRNASVRFHERRLIGLGIDEPPKLAPGCGCTSLELTWAVGIFWLLRRRRSC